MQSRDASERIDDLAGEARGEPVFMLLSEIGTRQDRERANLRAGHPRARSAAPDQKYRANKGSGDPEPQAHRRTHHRLAGSGRFGVYGEPRHATCNLILQVF